MEELSVGDEKNSFNNNYVSVQGDKTYLPLRSIVCHWHVLSEGCINTISWSLLLNYLGGPGCNGVEKLKFPLPWGRIHPALCQWEMPSSLHDQHWGLAAVLGAHPRLGQLPALTGRGSGHKSSLSAFSQHFLIPHPAPPITGAASSC